MTSDDDDDDDDDDHFLIRFFSIRYVDDDCDAFAGLSLAPPTNCWARSSFLALFHDDDDEDDARFLFYQMH